MSKNTLNNENYIQAVKGYVIPFNIGDMVYIEMGGYIISDIVKTISIDITGVFINDKIPIGNVFKCITEARAAMIENKKGN